MTVLYCNDFKFANKEVKFGAFVKNILLRSRLTFLFLLVDFPLFGG